MCVVSYTRGEEGNAKGIEFLAVINLSRHQILGDRDLPYYKSTTFKSNSITAICDETTCTTINSRTRANVIQFLAELNQSKSINRGNQVLGERNRDVHYLRWASWALSKSRGAARTRRWRRTCGHAGGWQRYTPSPQGQPPWGRWT